MSGTEDHKKKVQKIAFQAYKRRRDQQYQILLDWKSGKITGLECIEFIERLKDVINLKKTDFRPKPIPKPKPKK